jgi:hypothetical protein
MSHHGKSLGGVNIHVSDPAAKSGASGKAEREASRNADLDCVRDLMREVFRNCLAGGMTRERAADLVMATLRLGTLSASMPPKERARMHLGIQAETRNLVVGIQAGRARRAA